MPVAGSDACMHATFFIDAFLGDSTAGCVLPLAGPNAFDKAGMAMAVTNSHNFTLQPGQDALFNTVPGLDGLPGSVSLELGSTPGCFMMVPGWQIKQGLLDQYADTVAGPGRSQWPATWGDPVRSVIPRHNIERNWTSLNEEIGRGHQHDVLDAHLLPGIDCSCSRQRASAPVTRPRLVAARGTERNFLLDEYFNLVTTADS